MPSTRSLLATLATVATVISGGALLAPASANTGGTGLVISEVYGAGGNSGAVRNADYVELYNPTNAPISVVNDYIHYRSAGGTFSVAPAQLTGSVPAQGHYLIQMGTAGANGTALPTPDAGPFTFQMAAAGGQVFLLDSSAAIPATTIGNMVGVAHVIDMVGVSGSNSFETATSNDQATTTKSLNRSATGADSDSNLTDFTQQDPSPENSNPVVTPPSEHTIAEIQGTGDASPLNNQTVITQGVVTAAYPTGGFFGYVLQTDGTGTGDDATPGASDAVFVHQPSGDVAVQVGDYVQVTGDVQEFFGLTELSVDAADVEDLGSAPLGGVQARSMAYPTTAAGREAHESELIEPTDQFTVSDNFDTNGFGEIGLATGDHQLWQPTDLYNPNIEPGQVAAVQADNFARGVVLNDGASWNYLSSPHNNDPMAWLTPANPVRIGSTATLHQPMVLDYRNNLWELQPTTQVTGDGHQWATFSDTRSANQAPQAVGGDIKLGTFNVLNYFNTTGKDWVAEGGGHTCTFFNDRGGDPVGDNNCAPNGPRGAAESSGGTDLTDPKADLERQLAKEVKAINTMNADILSLEEIENSVALGESNRDDALASLVDALNAAAGTTRWAYAPSPDASGLPPLAQQDVIRTAFIYNPSTVQLVGPSKVLSDKSGPGQPFEDAREPLAQEFKRAGALDSDGFLVVVNHFKSKGSGPDDGTGQGLSNPARIQQAHALVDFATATAQADGTKKIFLVGDFNSYTQEDPMQVLYQNGFINQASDDPRDTSYEFDGQAGSLDHVLANASAANLVTGRDVWQINAEESVGFEYSRYNYNATLLYQDNQFRASDHNPELVGLAVPFSRQVSTVAASATPDRVKKKQTSSTIHVTVTGDEGVTPTGSVEIWVDGQQVTTVSLSGGEASASIGPFPTAGTRHVEVRYLGDSVTQPGTATTTVTVTNGNP